MEKETQMMNLQINSDIVSSIANKEIKILLTQALGGADAIMQEMVRTIVNRKCDISGKVSSYSSDNKYTFLDLILEKTIKEKTEKAIRDWVELNANTFEKLVQDYMKKEKYQKKILDAFMESAVDSFKNKYRFNTSINLADSNK